MHFRRCKKCPRHYTLTLGTLVVSTRPINGRRAWHVQAL